MSGDEMPELEPLDIVVVKTTGNGGVILRIADIEEEMEPDLAVAIAVMLIGNAYMAREEKP